MFQEKVPSIW